LRKTGRFLKKNYEEISASANRHFCPKTGHLCAFWPRITLAAGK
jgi:hypothetical protein